MQTAKLLVYHSITGIEGSNDWLSAMTRRRTEQQASKQHKTERKSDGKRQRLRVEKIGRAGGRRVGVGGKLKATRAVRFQPNPIGRRKTLPVRWCGCRFRRLGQ
jgi:hypothetical protein